MGLKYELWLKIWTFKFCLSRFEEVKQLFESESGEKHKETGHKLDELNGLIRKMEDELRDLNGTAANNANDINELKENDNALDARLEKIESEV